MIHQYFHLFAETSLFLFVLLLYIIFFPQRKDFINVVRLWLNMQDPSLLPKNLKSSGKHSYQSYF